MDLKKREYKIQEKRKETPWRDFIKEIISWYPIILYRNKGKLSRYPDTDRCSILSNSNDFTNEGINYDNQTSFFNNFKLFFKSIENEPLIHFSGIENAYFADIVSNSKNVYLSRNVTNGNENIIYSLGVKDGCKDIYNGIMVRSNSNIAYNSIGLINSFKVFYSKYIVNSNNIWFSSNLIGCTECLFCNNLENQSYYINNKKYNKKEYEIEKEKILKKKEMFSSWFDIVNNNLGINYGSSNVKGEFILNSKDVENGYLVNNVVDSHNVILGGYNYIEESLYDVMFSGAKANCYGTLCCGSKSEQIYSCFGLQKSFNMYYCYKCENCSYCLGCIGLQNKSFCILNKQYNKEERFAKTNEIFEQMNIDGTLGNFFPADMSPFYFNDTAAYLIDDSFTKEEVKAEGYLRRDEEIKVDIPEGLETIKTSDLNKYQGFDSEGNRNIDPEILKKVIVDKKGNSYRIIKMEYDFLMKHGLPLPEIHWLDRIKLGFKFK